MDRLSKIKTSETNASVDCSLIDSSLNDVYQTADEGSSSSRYCSVIDDTILDIPDITNTSEDIEVHNTDKTETEIKNFEEDLKCLSNSRTSDTLDRNYNAANILSGEVNIFDENSVDEPDLVIDDTVLIEVEIGSPQNADVISEGSPKSGSTFISPDNIKNNDKFIADEPCFERNTLIPNISQLSKKSSLAQPLHPPKDSVTGIEEKHGGSALNEGQIGEQVDISTTTNEVILQIDGKNVDAIDVGNGLYLYRKDGTEELTSVQIIQSETGEQQFKFLKVRQNEEGNLEVYEEQILEIPELQPLSLDHSNSAETSDATTTTTMEKKKCDLSPKAKKVPQKSNMSDIIDDNTSYSDCTEQTSSLIPSKVLKEDLCSNETNNVFCVVDDNRIIEPQLLKESDRISPEKCQEFLKQPIEESNTLLSKPSTSAIVISTDVKKNVSASPEFVDYSKTDDVSTSTYDKEIPKVLGLTDKLCSISRQPDMKLGKENKSLGAIEEDSITKVDISIPKLFSLPDKAYNNMCKLNAIEVENKVFNVVKADSLVQIDTILSAPILNGDIEINHEPHIDIKKSKECIEIKESLRNLHYIGSLSGAADGSGDEIKEHGSKEIFVINQNEKNQNSVEVINSKLVQNVQKFTSSVQKPTFTTNNSDTVHSFITDKTDSKTQLQNTVLPQEIALGVPKIENVVFVVSDQSETSDTLKDSMMKGEKVYKTSSNFKEKDAIITIINNSFKEDLKSKHIITATTPPEKSTLFQEEFSSSASSDIHKSKFIAVEDSKEAQPDVICISKKEEVKDTTTLIEPLTSIVERRESSYISLREKMCNSKIDLDITKKEILPVGNKDSDSESYDVNNSLNSKEYCIMDSSIPEISQVTMDCKRNLQQNTLCDNKSSNKIFMEKTSITNIHQRKNNNQEILEVLDKVEPIVDHKEDLTKSHLECDNDLIDAYFDKNSKLTNPTEINLRTTKNKPIDKKPTSEWLHSVNESMVQSRIQNTKPTILNDESIRSNVKDIKQNEKHPVRINDNADLITAPFGKKVTTKLELKNPEEENPPSMKKKTFDEKPTSKLLHSITENISKTTLMVSNESNMLDIKQNEGLRVSDLVADLKNPHEENLSPTKKKIVDKKPASEWLHSVTENLTSSTSPIVSPNESAKSNMTDIKLHEKRQHSANENADLNAPSSNKKDAPEDIFKNIRENALTKSKTLDKNLALGWLCSVNENTKAMTLQTVMPNNLSKSDMQDEKCLTDRNNAANLMAEKPIEIQKENAKTILSESLDEKPNSEWLQSVTENIGLKSTTDSNIIATETRDADKDPKTEFIINNDKTKPYEYGLPSHQILLIKSNTSANNSNVTESIDNGCTFKNSPEGKKKLHHNLFSLPKKQEDQSPTDKDEHNIENDYVNNYGIVSNVNENKNVVVEKEDNLEACNNFKIVVGDGINAKINKTTRGSDTYEMKQSNIDIKSQKSTTEKTAIENINIMKSDNEKTNISIVDISDGILSVNKPELVSVKISNDTIEDISFTEDTLDRTYTIKNIADKSTISMFNDNVDSQMAAIHDEHDSTSKININPLSAVTGNKQFTESCTSSLIKDDVLPNTLIVCDDLTSQKNDSLVFKESPSSISCESGHKCLINEIECHQTITSADYEESISVKQQDVETIQAVDVTPAVISTKELIETLSEKPVKITKDALPIHGLPPKKNFSSNLSPKTYSKLETNLHDVPSNSMEVQEIVGIKEINEGIIEKVHIPSKFEAKKASQSKIVTLIVSNELSPLTCVVFDDKESGTLQISPLCVESSQKACSISPANKSDTGSQNSCSMESDPNSSADESLNSDSLLSKLKHPRKQILKPVVGSDTEIVFPNDLEDETEKKVKKKGKNVKSALNVKKNLWDSGPTEKSHFKDILGDNSASSKTDENLSAIPPKKKMLARAANLTKTSLEDSRKVSCKSIIKSKDNIDVASDHSHTDFVNNESALQEIKVTPKRGRPRKSLIEVSVKPTDNPTVISKSTIIKEKKIEILDDDVELSLSEDDTVKENWTMGKIDENIVCPICNKQFRSENVVFKHVKHCLGPTKEISIIRKRKSFMDHANSSDTLVNYHSVEEQEMLKGDELHNDNKQDDKNLNNKFLKNRKMENSCEKEIFDPLNHRKTIQLVTEITTALHIQTALDQPRKDNLSLNQPIMENSSIDQSRKDNVEKLIQSKDIAPLNKDPLQNRSAACKPRVIKQFGSKFTPNRKKIEEAQIINDNVVIIPVSTTQNSFEITRTTTHDVQSDEHSHTNTNINHLVQNIEQTSIKEFNVNLIEETEPSILQNDPKVLFENVEDLILKPKKDLAANIESAKENIKIDHKTENPNITTEIIESQVLNDNLQREIDPNTILNEAIASENDIISITSQKKNMEIIEIMDTPSATKKVALVKRKIDRNNKNNLIKKSIDTPITRLTKILKTNPVQANLTCEICGKTFRQLAYLVNHRSIHKSKTLGTPENPISSDGMFSCDVCHKNYRKLHHLVQHRQTHVREKRILEEKAIAEIKENKVSENEEKVDVVIVSEESVADKVITEKDNNTHENYYSTGGFRCEACGKSFRKLHHLVEHREIHDFPKATTTQLPFYSTKDIIHECPKCYMVFPNEPSLIRHIELCQRKKNQNKEIASTNGTKKVDTFVVNETMEILDTIPVLPVKRLSRSSCSSDRRSIVSSRSTKSKEGSSSLVNTKVDPPKIKSLLLKPTVPAKDVSIKSKFVDDDLVRYKLSPSFIKASKRLSVQNDVTSSLPKMPKLARRKSEFVNPKRKTMLIAGPSNAVQQKNIIQLDKNKIHAHKKILKDSSLVTAISKKGVEPVTVRKNFATTTQAKIIPKLPVRHNPINKTTLKENIANTKRVPLHEGVNTEMRDNDDTTIRYSFPKRALKARESPSNTSRSGYVAGTSKESTQAAINIKGTKLQTNPPEKRKSLSGIIKRKSLIMKKTQIDMKAQLIKIKAVNKTAANVVSHLCDCGDTFSSSALLARHIRIAHTPPRGRRNTMVPDRKVDHIKREKSDLSRAKIPHSGVPMSDKMKNVMSRSKIFGASKEQ